MSTIFKNFDFNPVNIVRGTTASYTVPAGRYARVNISYDASFSCSKSGDVTGWAGDTLEYGGNYTGNLDVWLKEGDVISLVAANSTGSASLSQGVGSQNLSATAIAGVNININGSLWRTVQARAGFAGSHQGPPSTVTYTITPTVNFGYVAQEFNRYS